MYDVFVELELLTIGSSVMSKEVSHSNWRARGKENRGEILTVSLFE